MMSYPSFGGPCRLLQYPDINSLYKACHEAGVWCEHILIYREAYDIIKSTTINRHFALTKQHHIKMMTSMLNIINSQLLGNPNQLATCWNYGSSDGGAEDVGALLGVERSNFTSFYSSIYRAKPPLSNDEKLKIVPKELQVYMDSMIQANEQVWTTCRNQLQLKRQTKSF